MSLENTIKEEAKILLKNLTTCQDVQFWRDCRIELLNNIINGDITNFLNWKVIRDTMFVANTDYSKKEYNGILNSKNYIKYSFGLMENMVGNPIRSTFSPSTSDNLIHTIYHLSQYEEKTNKNISDNQIILEFGGGYGCMANTINKLNLCDKYIIFDFPEFNLLQKYYLLKNNIQISTDINNIQSKQVYLTSDINDLFKLQKFDLLIATWSLSESPIEFRTKLLSNIIVKNYLLAYQKQFDDSNAFHNIDNETFFNSLTNNLNYKWFNNKIEHLYGEQYYLFGTEEISE